MREDEFFCVVKNKVFERQLFFRFFDTQMTDTE